jgi:hypothetical protein
MSIEHVRTQLEAASSRCLAGTAGNGVLAALSGALEAKVLVAAAGAHLSARNDLEQAMATVDAAITSLHTAQEAVMAAANTIDAYSASI